MISRRAFLSALAALPFVGKLIPQEAVTRADFYGWDIGKSESVTVYTLVDEQGICARYDFDKEAWVFYRKPKADLSNIRAEWDRTYQSNDAT